MHSRLTRRGFIKAGAALAVASRAGIEGRALARPQGCKTMKPGIKIRKPARIVASCCLLLVAGGIAPAAQKGQDIAAEMGRAKEAQQQGNYKAAEEIYLGLLANNPDLPPAEFGLGATYYVDHQYEQSNKYLLKTLQKQPGRFPRPPIGGNKLLEARETGAGNPLLEAGCSSAPHG